MIKRMILMIVAVVVILGGIIGFKMMMAMGTKKFLAAMPVPAQTVSTAKAEMQPWQKKVEAVGSLRAINGADLAPKAAGTVEKIAFESGADVEKDALLVQLNVDEENAKLRSLQAAAALAQITFDRDTKQLKAQAVSQATVDADTATLNSAKAAVAEQQAVIDNKIVRAPFAGHLGIRKVDIGQYVAQGTAVVTLQQLDPIYIDFNLPEQALADITAGQKVVATADALGTGSAEGEISAINAKVDEATRNIQVRATFKNPEHKLLPGMFAHINVTVGEAKPQLTLPQTAITYNPYGNTVFLVTKDDSGKAVAKQTFVTVGATRGDQVAILSGVKEGDEVVTSGQLKLRNGSPLTINNEIQLKNDESPKPEDK